MPHPEITDQVIEQLAQDLESERVERKISWSKDVADKAYQAVCAFANALFHPQEAGFLLVGVDDSGQPSSLPITDQLLLTLADIRDCGLIVPQPTIRVEKRQLRGIDIAVVTVLPTDSPPVRYKGRIWVRTGPRRSIATAQEERILNERRLSRDLPFDLHPHSSCPLEELHRATFEQYLTQAFAPDVLEANERSWEQRLAACRMIEATQTLRPTVLGILTLGKTPRSWVPCAYIQFLRFRGQELTSPIVDEAFIDGDLATMLRSLDEKLRTNIASSIDIQGDLEKRQPDYPLSALQQLVRNAVMHRSYETTNAPIRVYWFEDRIEIHSPGGPFGQVTADNFGTPGITDYRNPHIAEVLKVLGYVQRFGIGIATARKELEKNGNPPVEFQVEVTSVLAIVRRVS